MQLFSTLWEEGRADELMKLVENPQTIEEIEWLFSLVSRNGEYDRIIKVRSGSGLFT